MVLKRIRDLVVATVNEGLDRMEDPIIMINQYLRDLEEEIEKANHSIVRHKSLQQGFKEHKEEAQQMSEKRYKQAHLAMDAGNEVLAKKALYEKKHYDERIAYYNDLLEKATSQVQDLMDSYTKLKGKYEELKNRKVALVARANVAKTKNAMQRSLHQSTHPSMLKDFERLEGRIREMEVKVDVYNSHSPEGKADPFQALEEEADIEKTLEALRKERQKETVSLDKDDTAPEKEAL